MPDFQLLQTKTACPENKTSGFKWGGRKVRRFYSYFEIPLKNNPNIDSGNCNNFFSVGVPPSRYSREFVPSRLYPSTLFCLDEVLDSVLCENVPVMFCNGTDYAVIDTFSSTPNSRSKTRPRIPLQCHKPTNCSTRSSLLLLAKKTFSLSILLYIRTTREKILKFFTCKLYAKPLEQFQITYKWIEIK